MTYQTNYREDLMQIDDLEDLLDRETAGLFLGIIVDEANALTALLPEALDRQWSASPYTRRDGVGGPSGGADHPDPTASAALDPRRQRVRASVLASMEQLRETAIALRGARRGMERALDRFDGVTSR